VGIEGVQAMAKRRARPGFAAGFKQTLFLIRRLSGAPFYLCQWSPRMGYLGKVSKAWAMQAWSPLGPEVSPPAGRPRKTKAWRPTDGHDRKVH
jgi:hypothetical protein